MNLAPTGGFFGWFNRLFSRSTNGYVNRVGKIAKKPARYLLIYAAIFIAMGWLFTKLPGSFLPEEDQGYFINVIQLPAGASKERTLEVLNQVEQFYLKQSEVEHVIGVAGFSFFGRGQNMAIAFVRLKGWDERPAADSSSVALVRKANMALFRIKQAMIFAINPPPIPELAASGGFDFRLQDRGGLGREKLLEARNMALGMAAQNLVLAGVRPEGQVNWAGCTSNTVQERDIALTTSKGLTDSLAKSSVDRELIDGQMKVYRDRLLGFGGISLSLQAVNILPISPSVFEYNIDLMQLRQKASASRGTFSIRLIQEGNIVDVPLANNKVEITDFQRLTGRWTMPAGFTPQFIEVSANAGGQSTIQRFAWERGAPLKNMPQMSIPDALANKSAS